MTSEEAWERFVGAMRHGSPFVTQQERAKAYADARVREARAVLNECRVFLEARDLMNAAVHRELPRFSALTLKVVQVLAKGGTAVEASNEESPG